ncbi:MAG: hypothetical protein ABFD64_04420 [Armatimonadota bacterium]
MAIDRTITSFSREERRRMSQAQRTGRGFTPPGPGQQRRGSGCCLFLLLLVVAIIAYAYIEAYWLAPKREKQEKKESSSVSSVIVMKTDEQGITTGGITPVVMASMCMLKLPYLVPAHNTSRPNWTGTQIG